MLFILFFTNRSVTIKNHSKQKKHDYRNPHQTPDLL